MDADWLPDALRSGCDCGECVCCRSAAEIERLRARVAALTAALRNLRSAVRAKAADPMGFVGTHLLMGDAMKDADAALADTPSGGEGG